ncbi:MAG: asparaginase domain-containing protein [Patescibacteria group bacterium]|nr:asparaginase domain-containing protein [Patescibacteria group bacterium]
MVTNRKKICFLLCGQNATIGPDHWFSQMPEVGILADIEPVVVFDKPSADIIPEVWQNLAAEIFARLKAVDGFVVFHDVDNILYSSSAISFMLTNLTKPVIFTGGHYVSQSDRKLEVKANLINAVQAAGYQYSDVGLMFGNRLLRANQAVRSADESLNLFTASPSAVLGRIDFSIRLADKLITKNKGVTKLVADLNGNIEVLTLAPVINLRTLAKKVIDRDAIIIDASSYLNLPADVLFFLEKITNDLPVVIWSDKIRNQIILPKNLIIVSDITWPAAVTKLMWVLGQTKNISKIRELMAKDVAGEIIKT